MKFDLPQNPIEKLLRIMEILRSPQGCPWDREQDHASIRNNLLEETYEVLEAIDQKDSKLLKEELGDLLLQVVFHSQLEKEKGVFNFEEVAEGVSDKLIRRHPHVFEDGYAPDSDTVLKNWNEIKKREKPERRGFFEGIPQILPALMRCQEIHKKAAKTGFDWKNAQGVLSKVKEELKELEQEIEQKGSSQRLEEELGDLFSALCNLARHLKIDAEQSCRLGTNKFQKRFEKMKSYVDSKNQEISNLTDEEKLKLWREIAKQPSI